MQDQWITKSDRQWGVNSVRAYTTEIKEWGSVLRLEASDWKEQDSEEAISGKWEASHSNPKHFTDFKTSCEVSANGYEGIGIGVFNDIGAVDYDRIW